MTTGGNNWITPGGALNNERYSSLDQINPGNVGNLRGAWMTRLGSGKGGKYKFEADPIVIDGVMYLATGNDDIFALDATNGKKLLVVVQRHSTGHRHRQDRLAGAARGLPQRLRHDRRGALLRRAGVYGDVGW